MLLTAESLVVKASLAASLLKLMSSVCLTHFLLLPVAIPVTTRAMMNRKFFTLTVIYTATQPSAILAFGLYLLRLGRVPVPRVTCVRHVLCIRMYRMRLFPQTCPFCTPPPRLSCKKPHTSTYILTSCYIYIYLPRASNVLDCYSPKVRVQFCRHTTSPPVSYIM